MISIGGGAAGQRCTARCGRSCTRAAQHCKVLPGSSALERTPRPVVDPTVIRQTIHSASFPNGWDGKVPRTPFSPIGITPPRPRPTGHWEGVRGAGTSGQPDAAVTALNGCMQRPARALSKPRCIPFDKADSSALLFARERPGRPSQGPKSPLAISILICGTRGCSAVPYGGVH
jgi:hypothetical protein